MPGPRDSNIWSDRFDKMVGDRSIRHEIVLEIEGGKGWDILVFEGK